MDSVTLTTDSADRTPRLTPRLPRTGLLPSPQGSADEEALLSHFLEGFVDRDSSALRYALAHPRASAHAFVAIHRLPRLAATLGASAEARAIELGLSRSVRGRSALHDVTAVLSLPSVSEQYRAGSSKQTLRRKIRAASKLGITWRRVDDLDERRDLLRLAHDQERSHPQDQYRIDDPANFDLLDYRLWLVAYAADGRPLLVSVTPVDGEWALLRYFRTLGVGPEHSDARYLMTDALVTELVRSGVRYLADSKSPFNLTNGLRHFQRMLGFRMVRVEFVGDPGSEWAG